jgi:cytochrome c peroxidase
MTAPWFSLALVLASFACAGAALTGVVDDRALQRIAHPPLGLPAVRIPPSNPLAAAKIRLGRQLFFDARLSADGRMLCATCHEPREAFTQTQVTTPRGASGSSLPRNAPTLINAAYAGRLMHNGEAHSLEAQVLSPLFAADEMANPSIAGLVSRVAALSDYAGRFEAAFGESPSISNIAKALACYERTLLSGNAPFDLWRYGGKETALSEVAKAGYALFTGKARCAACHAIGEADALFTDQSFHNTGIGSRAAQKRSGDQTIDLGRETVTHDPLDRFKYRTPSLRNVTRTGPYMHDGSLASLRDVVEFYNTGGAPNIGLDPLIRPLDISDAEIASLVAFLESLTGDNVDDLANEAYAVEQ